MSYICVWYYEICRKCLFWFIIKKIMYVISLKWREKPGRPVTSCAYFLMLFVNVERPRAFRAQLTNFTCVGGQRSNWGSSDQTVSSPSPRSFHTYNHTQIYWHLQATSGKKSPPLCSLSVFKPILWFVSSFGGLAEHSFAGSTGGLEGLT